MNSFLTENQSISNVFSPSNKASVEEMSVTIPPFSHDFSNIIVPVRFMEQVICHVVSPYLEHRNKYLPPLYLAIKGSAGEGKTVQSIASCTQKGFHVVYISASTLSGSHEDEAKAKLDSIYKYALEMRKNHLVAIIIDDFHKGIVNEDKSKKKTINSDVLTGYMMNLAEHNGNDHIPIILTANDFSDVYSPLLRIGRADIFEWQPNDDEKKEIVRAIFSSFITEINPPAFNEFYKIYSSESIAFFAQLRNCCRKNTIKSILSQTDYFDITILARMNSRIASQQQSISFEDVTTIAEMIIKERGK